MFVEEAVHGNIIKTYYFPQFLRWGSGNGKKWTSSL